VIRRTSQADCYLHVRTFPPSSRSASGRSLSVILRCPSNRIVATALDCCLTSTCERSVCPLPYRLGLRAIHHVEPPAEPIRALAISMNPRNKVPKSAFHAREWSSDDRSRARDQNHGPRPRHRWKLSPRQGTASTCYCPSSSVFRKHRSQGLPFRRPLIVRHFHRPIFRRGPHRIADGIYHQRYPATVSPQNLGTVSS